MGRGAWQVRAGRGFKVSAMERAVQDQSQLGREGVGIIRMMSVPGRAVSVCVFHSVCIVCVLCPIPYLPQVLMSPLLFALGVHLGSQREGLECMASLA